jgi:hypothetical protein
MRTAVALAILAASVAVLVSSGSAAAAKPPATISIGPIEADFVAAKRETQYYVSRYHLNGKPEPVTVT